MTSTFTEATKKPPEESGHFERMLTIKEAANELGEALTADEIARVKHRRAYGQAKAGRPRDPGILPGENQVIGKEVKKTTQKSAEGAVRDTSAAQAARDASINRDFDRVVCTRHLIHDWPVPIASWTDCKCLWVHIRRSRFDSRLADPSEQHLQVLPQ